VDEPGAREGAEVLGHRLARHRQLAGQRGRGQARPHGERAHDLAPRRVGERGEDRAYVVVRGWAEHGVTIEIAPDGI
jgi:hypothetical protein